MRDNVVRKLTMMLSRPDFAATDGIASIMHRLSRVLSSVGEFLDVPARD
jgi:hypothetical protein